MPDGGIQVHHALLWRMNDRTAAPVRSARFPPFFASNHLASHFLIPRRPQSTSMESVGPTHPFEEKGLTIDLRHGKRLALTPQTCVLLRSEISAM